LIACGIPGPFDFVGLSPKVFVHTRASGNLAGEKWRVIYNHETKVFFKSFKAAEKAGFDRSTAKDEGPIVD